jgi:uncharacterized protein YecE (DUF72 family)
VAQVFYPEGLPHARELAYASRVFDSVEINGSFYSLMRPSAVQAWRAAVPDDFVFAPFDALALRARVRRTSAGRP